MGEGHCDLLPDCRRCRSLTSGRAILCEGKFPPRSVGCIWSGPGTSSGSWFFVIISVWASTIAGFALSLAAVAGAVLIVSKELLMCVLGYLYITFVRPFKVGDLIEINQLHGRVIDIDIFATTLAELAMPGSRPARWLSFRMACC